MDSYFDFFMPDYEYFYEPQPVAGGGSSVMLYLFWVIVAVMAILFMTAVATLFVVKGISLYTLSKNRGMKNNVLSVVPFVNRFYLGKIADDINVTMNKKTSLGISIISWFSASVLLLIMSIPFSIVYFVSGNARIFLPLTIMLYFLAFLTYCVYKIFQIKALYRIYKEYAYENAMVYSFLSLFFGASAFILFKIKDKKSGYQTWLESRESRPEPEHAVPEIIEQDEPENRTEQDGTDLEEFEISE